MFGTATGSSSGKCQKCYGVGKIIARTEYLDVHGQRVPGMYKADEKIKCDACEGFGDAGAHRAWRELKYGQQVR